MGALFSKPKQPAPPPVAPPPPAMTAVETDIAAQAMQQQLQRGRTSTMLTGGKGLEDTGETTKKTLLGA
jgi:hypothetical protein